MGRARRRQDLARMKARARRIYPHDKKARLANHLHSCSCLMWCNPRRHMGAPTLQEVRIAEAEVAQIRDATGDDEV